MIDTPNRTDDIAKDEFWFDVGSLSACVDEGVIGAPENERGE